MSKKADEDNIEYVGSYFLEEDANGILVSLEPGLVNELEIIKTMLLNGELGDITCFINKEDVSLSDVIKELLTSLKEYRSIVIQLNDLLLAVDNLSHTKVRDMIKNDLITENYIKYIKNETKEDEYQITRALCKLEQIGLGYS